MPYKRRYKRKRRRRKRRYKRKSRKGGYAVVIRGPSAFPDRYRAKLKWVNHQGLTPGTATGTLVFRMNSCFDPGFTSGSSQPQGFDELASLYNRYRVFASSITIHITNFTVDMGMRFVLFPTNESAVNGVSNVLSSPYAKFKHVGSPTGIDVGTMKHYMTVSKMRGQRGVSTDMDWTGSTGGNPQRIVFWGLSFESSNRVDALDIALLIQMTFYVEFTDRVQLALS